jgi:uncharacterized protein YlzI (FlbEa/FlbD family)
MAKFIEIKQASTVTHYKGTEIPGFVDEVREVVYDTTYINADRIESIFPQGDSCIITLIGGERITAKHSAIWVLAQINEQ